MISRLLTSNATLHERGRAVGIVTVAAAALSLLAAAPAGAQPSSTTPTAVPAHTAAAASASAASKPSAASSFGPCLTDYTGVTVNCTPSTTATPSYPLTLSLSYANGIVSWQACGYPDSAVGKTAVLRFQGRLLDNLAGGSGPINAGMTGGAGTSANCTTDPEFPICLSNGSYTGDAEVSGFAPNADAPLTGVPDVITVTHSDCVATTALVTGSGTTSTGSDQAGALAFTGSNVFRLALLALIVILAGSGITVAARRRRLR